MSKGNPRDRIASRDRLFITTMLAGLAMGVGGAGAQQAVEATPSAAESDEIIVTGSRIRRSPETAPTPLIQIDQKAVITSGEQNVVDFLADIPALQNSQVYEDTTGGFVGIGGLAFLNLRNLGSARTLVLVDGRRHVAGDPAGARVDVDTIPTSLVEKIEIVTGGASALYGSDAVSGVVNFITKNDFSGLEIDAAIGQLTQANDMTNDRFSVTVGKNFADGRGNVYAFAEYQASDAVYDKDLEISWIQSNSRLVTVDADPASALSDGVFDAEVLHGLRSLNRPRGGILRLANGTRPSPSSDPDIPFGSCTAGNANSIFVQANCFATNPGKSYQFTSGGTPYLANFGETGAPVNFGVVDRLNTIGGSGDTLVAVETNRLPEQESGRFVVGGHFDITDNLTAYGEVKYIDEQNIDVFQPHFSNIMIREFGATEYSYFPSDLTNFVIGLDNAYLDPALRSAILANQRTVYDSAGNVTGTVNDRRASFKLFSYDLGFRPSIADRETFRFVGGLKGDFDKLGPLTDISWDIGYTYGKMEAVNTEPHTIDQERYSYAADAVVDTLGEVGPAGQIVCRVKLLAARGVTIESLNSGTPYSASDPTIRDCAPARIFGEGGFSDAAKNYILTSLTTYEENKQDDVSGFFSANLWDFWGAGPIGFAVGGEYRREESSSVLTDFGDRVLFGNAGGNLPATYFEVKELFGEVNFPILKDLPGAQKLELNFADRSSTYSTIGQFETYSVSGFWQPVKDIAFRVTHGSAIRAPTIGELYSPPFDTFPSLNDPCSSPIINATSDANIRANRIANCAALGISPTYVDPAPTVSNQGKSGSNPLLIEEESYSHTISAIFTPRFLPEFSAVVDFYDIEIQNAIATLSAQTLLNLCVDSSALNDLACSVFTRAPAGAPNEFEVIDFIEGPFNYASLLARGIDFQANYGFDMDLGRIDLGINGNYLIRRQDFTNPTLPDQPTNIDTTANNPRVRFKTSATWTGDSGLALTWRTDFQASQELINPVTLGANVDTRESTYFETGDFWQNDFVFTYDFDDKYNLRGGKFSIRGGVVNIFDAEPTIQAGLADNFDLFGRRLFFGINYKH